MSSKTLKQRVAELVKEQIDIVPYDPNWPKLFNEEKSFLEKKLPDSIVKRIEHFGSTAIPGIYAKPIIDMLVEVSSLNQTKKKIVPILERNNYEYFWRPSIGNKPPFYAWFIKRNTKGNRTHHIHMVEKDSPLWDRIYFRDYLVEFPKVARQYGNLKKILSKNNPHDRIAYTKAKGKLITNITQRAKDYYLSIEQND